MDALAVRSLEELIGTVNADEVTSDRRDGTIHFYGEHDDSRARPLRTRQRDRPASLRGRGVRRWRLRSLQPESSRDRSPLEPADVEPRSF